MGGWEMVSVAPACIVFIVLLGFDVQQLIDPSV
jgi:hypothetical protein